MNKFEESFFQKYIPEWQEIKWIIHIHFIDIFAKIFLWLSMWAIIPSFLYFYSDRIKELIPFYYLEWLLIFVFIKVIYDIFDWYNDVWIVTDWWVISLERSLFKVKSNSIDFEKMEWVEVDQDWIIDKIFKKWTLIIHKFWDDSISLENTINPFKAVDLIEEVSNYEEEDIPDDKFDVIMDALGWVVENYLDKKWQKTEKQEKIEEAIWKVKIKDWTIDLR